MDVEDYHGARSLRESQRPTRLRSRRYGHRHDGSSRPRHADPCRACAVGVRHHGLRLPDVDHHHDRDHRVEDAESIPRREQGICVASHGSTIVALRDGRRSRPWHADVAQLVAHHLAKVRVAGSNPVIRSKVRWHQPHWWSGRVVRQRPAKPCTRVRFPSPPPRRTPGAISSAGERFPDTEEVTGSIPVSRTTVCAVQRHF